MIIWTEQRRMVEAAAAEFPAEFGLRAFPAERFRINIADSYVNDDLTVMLYLGIKKADQWPAFGKGTIAELKREITK